MIRKFYFGKQQEDGSFEMIDSETSVCVGYLYIPSISINLPYEVQE